MGLAGRLEVCPNSEQILLETEARQGVYTRDFSHQKKKTKKKPNRQMLLGHHAGVSGSRLAVGLRKSNPVKWRLRGAAFVHMPGFATRTLTWQRYATYTSCTQFVCSPSSCQQSCEV